MNRYHSKLSKEQVQKVREYLTCGLPIKQEWIAKQFGVSQCTIAYHHKKIKKSYEQQKA